MKCGRAFVIATYQNTVLIYNPVAGKVRSTNGRIIQRALELLEREGIRARAVPTTGPGTAGEIARQAILKDPDLIVAMGGDGTINEVANGMVFSHVPLAVLPAGTANVLAMELGLGNRLDKAVRMLPQCAPERISVGQVNSAMGSRYFLLMAGAGLDAQIVYNVNANVKKQLGKLAYWSAGFSMVGRSLSQLDALLNGDRHRCGFALASRVKNYGGDLTIATGASLFENDFETVLFEGRHASRFLLHFSWVLAQAVESFPGVRVERARKVEFQGAGDERVYIQVDGEFAGRLPARIEIVENALTLMAPVDARQRLGIKATEALMPASG